MQCRVCLSQMNYVETLARKSPRGCILHSQPESSKLVDIKMYRCPNCSHVQIDYEMDNNLYTEYEMEGDSQDVSQIGRFPLVLIDYYDQCFEKLSEYVNSHNLVLDIGCGVGTLMYYERKYFKKVLGIEPSKAECKIARKNGHWVINDFFTSSLELEKIEMVISAFVSIHVFEHVSELRNTLNYAYNVLEPGGVGFIDVPNGEKIFNEKVYYDVFGEHINYFTPLSLCTLAYACGFEVISLGEGWNRNHLHIFIRKPLFKIATFEEERDKDLESLNSIIKQYRSVGIWGCGNKAQSILDLVEKKDNLKYLFDSAKDKCGKYMDSMSVAISMPSSEKISECDLIIIFAISYTDEIISALRTEYMYKGDIVYFNKEIKIDKL